jgi:1-acyl-sn-glycerol-3-phosphate acyltransferase
MGAMLGSLCQAIYGVALATNMLWATAVMKCLSLLPLSKQTLEGTSLVILQACWMIAGFFAPWMRCKEDKDTAEEWRKIQAKMAEVDTLAATGKASYRPLMILGNHTSFFDTVLSVTAFPSSVLYRCRTYMSSHLFGIPILATICRTVGHFPVYFQSSTEGKFTVDKEKAEIVDQKVNQHLNSGGWLCFYPEGQMNKTPDTILPFRFGGIKKALDYDARLVSFVAYGNPAVWPLKAQIGGLPGRVRYSLRLLAPDGAKKLVEELRQNVKAEDKDKEDHVLLAEYAQALMQNQYDLLKEQMLGGRKSKTN